MGWELLPLLDTAKWEKKQEKFSVGNDPKSKFNWKVTCDITYTNLSIILAEARKRGIEKSVKIGEIIFTIPLAH